MNWIVSSSKDGNYVTYYIISYTPSCPKLSSVNDTVSVAPHQSITTYSYTLRGLYSGMNYTITVRAGNVLGGSDSILTNGATIPLVGISVIFKICVPSFSIVPSGWLNSFQISLVNSTANNLTWNEINCSQHNGLITGYTVMIMQ